MEQREKLFLSQADIIRLRRHVKDPRFAFIWQKTLATAGRIADTGSMAFPEDTMEIWYVFRNRSIDLGLALLATQDQRYAAAIHDALCELDRRGVDFWQGPHYPNRPRTQIVDGEETLVGELETAQLSMGVALLYDLGYDYLPEGDRQLALSLLKRYAYPLLGASVRFQSKKWVMNHLCVLSAAWLLTLLLLPEGERKEDDLALAIRSLELWIGNIESDGSYGEGYHYWAYPVNCLFFAMQVLAQSKGVRLRNEGRIARAFEWAIYHQAGIVRENGYARPVAAALNFHDCPRFFQMEAPEALLFANITGNPVAQWYIDRFLLSDLSRPDESLHIYWHRADSLLLALYRDEQMSLSPEQAGYAGARCFMDTGYQFLRASWTMDHDLVFAMESGGGSRSRSHEHHDRNSFVLYAGGELFIADPGHSCYRGERHNAYDTQTRAHSTWTVNGENQHLEYLEMGMLATEARQWPSYRNGAAPFQQLHPEISMMASQARRCYEPAWRNYMRRAFLVYGQYVLIWDSVDPGDKQGRLTCPLTLNTRDGAARLLLQDRTLRMIRPRKDLFLAVASDGGRVSLALEDGILHDAYHIRPHMPVEGGVGSAKRLVLTSEAGRLECVMLLYPLDHEEKPPEFQAEFGNGGIRVTVKGNGAEDRFLLGDPDIQFSRAGGAAYAF